MVIMRVPSRAQGYLCQCMCLALLLLSSAVAKTDAVSRRYAAPAEK